MIQIKEKLKAFLHEEFRSWLPDLIIGKLPVIRKWLVKSYLGRNQRLRNEHRTFVMFQAALREQQSDIPSPEVFQNIQKQIHSHPKIAIQAAGEWKPWIIPLVLLFVAGFLLWQSLPPIISLAWTSQSQEVQSFKIFRVNADESGASEQAVLLKEVPADSLDNRYSYSEIPLFPGHEVIYRIDAVDKHGLLATTKIIVSDGINALFGQITLIIISCLIFYVLWILTRHQSVRSHASRPLLY